MAHWCSPHFNNSGIGELNLTAAKDSPAITKWHLPENKSEKTNGAPIYTSFQALASGLTSLLGFPVNGVYDPLANTISFTLADGAHPLTRIYDSVSAGISFGDANFGNLKNVTPDKANTIQLQAVATLLSMVFVIDLTPNAPPKVAVPIKLDANSQTIPTALAANGRLTDDAHFTLNVDGTDYHYSAGGDTITSRRRATFAVATAPLYAAGDNMTTIYDAVALTSEASITLTLDNHVPVIITLTVDDTKKNVDFSDLQRQLQEKIDAQLIALGYPAGSLMVSQVGTKAQFQVALAAGDAIDKVAITVAPGTAVTQLHLPAGVTLLGKWNNSLVEDMQAAIDGTSGATGLFK